MKTEYSLHDRQYQKRRAAGKLGWNDADAAADNLTQLGMALAADYYPKSGRVLELGCGAGDLSLELARRGYEVSGIDIAPAAIEWARDKARERGLNADFQVGSVLDLANYADASFDMVLDGYCLHCIIGDDRPKFYAAARRVLRPGGLLRVNTMWADDLLTEESLGGYDPQTRCQIWDGVALRFFGLPEELLAEASAASFEIVKSQVCPRPHPNYSAMLLIDARKPLA